MTKIKYLFLFFLLLCASEVDGQQKTIDSLNQKFEAAKGDSAKNRLLFEIINSNSKKVYEQVMFSNRHILQILMLKMDFGEAKEDSAKIRLLTDIFLNYRNVNIDSCVFYAQQLLLLCIKNKKNFVPDPESIALNHLAFALWNAGNYTDAKETYFKALEIAEVDGDKALLGGIYCGLAMVNSYEGNFEKAINYYSKAELLAKDINIPDNDLLFQVIVDKGKVYEQLGILDSATNYTMTGIAMLYRKYHDQNIGGGGIQANMGIIYSKLGKEKLAAEYFRLSFRLSEEVDEQRLLARGYFEFAEHFDRYNQQDSAIYYATKGLLIDRKYNFLVQQLAASKLLTKLYTQKNKIDSAFKYQSLMIVIRDTIFSHEKVYRLQNLEFKEQTRQLEIESAKKISEEKRKQNIQYTLIALGIVILIIIVLLCPYFITNPKLIKFLGIMALLISFEFINLFLHPFLERITHHSLLFMLLFLVCIAGLLIPLHHKLEKLTTTYLLKKNDRIKNKRMQLAEALKMIKQ